MSSQDSAAVPGTSVTCTPAMDLKRIVKDSLRELVQEEPALFTREVESASPGTARGSTSGGEFSRAFEEQLVVVDASSAPGDGPEAGERGGEPNSWHPRMAAW